jgi:ABC-type multidrug transport system ATPase subunit
LVEVGSGFHPELTGRENIDLHGAMLGMRSSEIRRKLDSIIEFSGVGQYIDVPVKRYSSGMYVRLGFSIAAHLDPDILLLDEVLAVGDAAFQAKCLDRIAELRRAGRTMLFISHDLAAVYRLCDRALLLDHGRVVADGPPREIIDEYQQMTFSNDPGPIEPRRTRITGAMYKHFLPGTRFHRWRSNRLPDGGSVRLSYTADHSCGGVSNLALLAQRLFMCSARHRLFARGPSAGAGRGQN